ncbi:MAG: DUF4097 family beta strand repeat-containing protein [Pseudomonadales bacterium]|jgi:DUF4097 and DUF4098 domain-containing protein YvlB|nr:DUF4097 family beta strand repeat-containing protein [Pseudomonadales bacterium]
MNRTIARAGLLVAVLAGPASADEDYHERLDAAPDGLVQIENVAGEIEVRGTDASEVEVSARLGEAVEELIFERDGDRILIKVEVRGGNGGWGWGSRDGSAELQVSVPEASDLRIEAVSSDISVFAVNGRLGIESVSGDIEIASASPALEATSMSGDVEFEGDGQTADAEITSVSGDVTIRDIGGEVHATSVSGSVELSLGEVSRLRAQSTSGDLSARVRLLADARVELETVSGEIELELGGARDGDYELSTFSGDLDNCFGPRAERRRYSPGRDLKFREGDGERDVRISTMSGSITLCD